MEKPLWVWLVFLGIVFFLLALDLGFFHRKSRAISVKESLAFSGIYILVAIIFGGFIWHFLGDVSGKEYFTGYLVEKSLSIDNIFVISLIFSAFSIPLKYQHRVLFWGILGVIILRAIMIGLGAKIVHEFAWVLYIFAAFLIITGIKILFSKEEKHDILQNKFVKFLQRHLRITNTIHNENFFVRLKDENTGKSHLYWTPLMLALVMIESADLIFAVDSIPAIFLITTDPYIIYTSNIFAILGLRALYFSLAVIVERFHYIKHALGVVLIFIGSKLFIADMLNIEKIPATISLAITITIITSGVLFSLYKTKK
jgi:tellurite resistance protein TerC